MAWVVYLELALVIDVGETRNELQAVHYPPSFVLYQ